MSIKVECPGCLKTIKAPDHYAGRVAKCPGCGNAVRIPEPVAAVVQKPVAPPLPVEVAAPVPVQTVVRESSRGDASKENDLMVVRPATFRSRPFAYSAVVFLFFTSLIGAATISHPNTGNAIPALWIIPLICIVILAKWHIEGMTTSLRITNKRSILRNGLLSKRTREVRHSDVRLLEVQQSLGQRIFGVGKVSVASAAHGAVEIEMEGVKNPEHVKETIDGYR
jgi:ribosomal protein S27E